jgi:hypothetical protein
MLQRLRFKDLQGISYKNLTIKLSAGSYQYNLASQSDLGLPQNALVFGVMLRNYPTAFENTKSKLGRDLLNERVLQSSVITILDIETKAILDEYPLEKARFNDTVIYFEPRKRTEIDWSKSTFTIIGEAERALVTSDQDFEIIVLYYDPDIRCDITPLLNLYSGIKMPGIRTSSFEVITDASIDDYPISEQSSLGIDEDDIILGYYPFQGNGIKQASGKPNLNSAYLTMSRQTRTFIDSLPLAFQNAPFWYFDTPYIPIQPTKARDIDWETSKIEFADPTVLVDGQGFVWNLVYWRNK